MRIGLIFIGLCLVALLKAQTFPVDTLVYNGPAEKRINLVLLGDGYRSVDMDKFQTDALNFTQAFFQEIPFAQYKNYFNVFKIRTPSVDAGADHPGTATDVNESGFPVSDVDTYFSSTFDYANIHRLLVATDYGRIYDVLTNNFPLYDQVVVLVNSPLYGGSGGPFAVVSTDASATEVALHELGHSFASLADEYWYTGGETYNRTAETNPSLVKWKNWMGTNAVGIYQHCCGGDSENWYRPHQDCKMRYLGPDFCPVCTEALVERIHTSATPIDDYSPVSTTFQATEDTLDFSVQLLLPEPNTLKVQWILNDTLLQVQSDQLRLPATALLPASALPPLGVNRLLCVVEDTSKLQRVDGHALIHAYDVRWKILKGLSGTHQLTSSLEEINGILYPNPTTDHLYLRIKNAISDPIILQLVDIQGRLLRSWNIPELSADQDFDLDLTAYPQGNYLLEMRVGGWKKAYPVVRQ
ncbi:MAG: M64 family metallopeptidase [Saprospiraceae bacterium]|nr:M64 family metallopeptidase [Saprospiraceae bacterium]